MQFVSPSETKEADTSSVPTSAARSNVSLHALRHDSLRARWPCVPRCACRHGTPPPSRREIECRVHGEGLRSSIRPGRTVTVVVVEAGRSFPGQRKQSEDLHDDYDHVGPNDDQGRLGRRSDRDPRRSSSMARPRTFRPSRLLLLVIERPPTTRPRWLAHERTANPTLLRGCS